MELEAEIRRIRNHNDNQKVLWVNEGKGEPFFAEHLDAMLAGQDLGMSVIRPSY